MSRREQEQKQEQERRLRDKLNEENERAQVQ